MCQDQAAPNSPELLLLKFLPLTYHHSHFLAATLDFTSFFTIAFLRAALFFYSLVALYQISRHTVVCRAAQETGAPHREYIDRKKQNVIFTPCISVIPHLIGPNFATEFLASQGSLHSKLEGNRSSRFRYTSCQSFDFFSWFFFFFVF